jgi:hypothetical protein
MKATRPVPGTPGQACIRVSPRTVRKYLDRDRPTGGSRISAGAPLSETTRPRSSLFTFIFITATFRIVYVLVAMEIGSRRILHCNVTEHPTAEWTVQQFREFLAFDHPYRFLIHDRQSTFSADLDGAIYAFGIWV